MESLRKRNTQKEYDNLLQVGAITSTHGVRGEVKVFPTTDDVKRFSKLKEVELETKEGTVTLHIQGVKYFKQFAIIKFKEYQSLNEVEGIKGSRLFVTRENAVKLQRNEFFIADLIGLKGVSDEDEDLGELTDVIQTGANDVYVFTKMGESDLLVPKIPDCVKEIDLEKGTVLIHLLPGLRD